MFSKTIEKHSYFLKIVLKNKFLLKNSIIKTILILFSIKYYAFWYNTKNFKIFFIFLIIIKTLYKEDFLKNQHTFLTDFQILL